MIGDIGKHTNQEVDAEKENQTENIVPYRKQKTCNVRKQRGHKKLKAIHSIIVQDI